MCIRDRDDRIPSVGALIDLTRELMIDRNESQGNWIVAGCSQEKRCKRKVAKGCVCLISYASREDSYDSYSNV